MFRRLLSRVSILALLAMVLAPSLNGVAYAAQLTEAAYMTQAQTATIATSGAYHTVFFKPASTATENEVRVTFPAGWTVNSTAANITVVTTSLPTLGSEAPTAAPAIGTAANAVSGQAVDFTVTDLTPTTLYAFKITGGITPAAGQAEVSIETLVGSNSSQDDMSVEVEILSDSTYDVSIDVDSIFDITVSDLAIDFSTEVGVGAVKSSDGLNSFQVATNAQNGFIIMLKSANAALTDATTGESILTTGTVNDAPSSLSAGTDGYVLDVDVSQGSNGDGTLAADAEYNGTDTSSGGTLSTTFENVATSGGTTDGDTATLIARVATDSTTAAGLAYNDTLTILAHANY